MVLVVYLLGIIAVVGLRKRKRHGLIMTYILTVIGFLVGLGYLSIRKGTFLVRLAKGPLAVLITIGWFICFYR
jgi:uncharacterized membrane protein YeaQ/YmgE (transglycosylase-associated protein family)